MSATKYKGYRIERTVFVRIYEPSDMFFEPLTLDFCTIKNAKKWVDGNPIEEADL